MTHDDRLKWDRRYADDETWQADRQPFPWLVEHITACEGVVALDLACGLGHDAIYLARLGYRVVAVDGSAIALRRGLHAARGQGLGSRILFVQADLDSFRPIAKCCDLLCVIRFLRRDLFPCLVSALRPGGVLIYATLNECWSDTHPDVNPEYLLKPGELLRAFPGMRLLDHREEGAMSYLACSKPRAR